MGFRYELPEIKLPGVKPAQVATNLAYNAAVDSMAPADMPVVVTATPAASSGTLRREGSSQGRIDPQPT